MQCQCPTDSEVKSGLDIGDGYILEMRDEFCYLGLILFVDGDADGAVTTKIRTVWFNFRSLASLSTAKVVS